MNIVPISRLRSEFSVAADADASIRALLAANALLVGDGIDGSRLCEVRRVLGESLATSCGDSKCDELAPHFGGSVVVRGAAARCVVCQGSVNERARKRVLVACHRSGVRRLVVVGGSPRAREELWGDYEERRPDGSRSGIGVEWRLVDGTGRPNEREARANLDWADIVVIWATTQLDHKVSMLYVNGRHPRTITCAQRSSAAVCGAITRAITGGSRSTSSG